MKTTTLKLMMVALGVLLSVNAHAYDAYIDGIYYNFDTSNKTAKVTCLSFSFSDNSSAYSGAVSIPATVTYNEQTYDVTSIGDYTFNSCSGLTSITIPNSVTSIGDYAFSGCSGLTSITIPESVTSIGDMAFSGCSGLTFITIPNSVTNIGYSAFTNTAWFNNQANGLIYINNVAYRYKGKMPSNTSITIMEGTVSISPYAFSGCSGLTSVTIPNSVTSIGGNAFKGCI